MTNSAPISRSVVSSAGASRIKQLIAPRKLRTLRQLELPPSEKETRNEAVDKKIVAQRQKTIDLAVQLTKLILESVFPRLRKTQTLLISGRTARLHDSRHSALK